MSHHNPFIFFLAKDLKRKKVTINCVKYCVFCSPEGWIGHDPIQLYGGFHGCLPNQTSCSIFSSFISKHNFIVFLYVLINQAEINLNCIFTAKSVYRPDMMVDVEGDYGSEDDDSRQRHQVRHIPHDKLLQMLTVGDLARVQLLKHCNETNK